jgi:hypothetical protein
MCFVKCLENQWATCTNGKHGKKFTLLVYFIYRRPNSNMQCFNFTRQKCRCPKYWPRHVQFPLFNVYAWFMFGQTSQYGEPRYSSIISNNIDKKRTLHYHTNKCTCSNIFQSTIHTTNTSALHNKLDTNTHKHFTIYKTTRMEKRTHISQIPTYLKLYR